MPVCKECQDEVEELTTIRVEGRRKRVCEDCADRLREEASIAEESESAVPEEKEESRFPALCSICRVRDLICERMVTPLGLDEASEDGPAGTALRRRTAWPSSSPLMLTSLALTSAAVCGR